VSAFEPPIAHVNGLFVSAYRVHRFFASAAWRGSFATDGIEWHIICTPIAEPLMNHKRGTSSVASCV
jgi:hypothetical protein